MFYVLDLTENRMPGWDSFINIQSKNEVPHLLCWKHVLLKYLHKYALLKMLIKVTSDQNKISANNKLPPSPPPQEDMLPYFFALYYFCYIL